MQRTDADTASDAAAAAAPPPPLAHILWMLTLPCPSFVQRDLKPQNLLLSEASPGATLKIADFGFARNLQPQVRGLGLRPP